MTRFGLDYTGRLSAAQHRAAGSSFACRYLSWTPSKNLSAAEASALHAGGIDIVTVWETTASRALAGHAGGAYDANAALNQARGCGIPTGRPIFFAIDFDESPSQAGAVAEYFRGVASVLGLAQTGAYGGYWAIKRLFDANLIRYGWQTYAWSGGSVDHRAQLYQYSNSHIVSGVGVDFNHALAEDFGQWYHHPTPVPAPTHHAQGRRLITVQFNANPPHGKHWEIVSNKGASWKDGSTRHHASAELQVEMRSGSARIVGEKFDAPPLGG